MPETKQNYINGEWCDSATGETVEVLNPADTSEIVNVYTYSDRTDVDEAISSAAKAQTAWEETPSTERGTILRHAASYLEARTEELAELLTKEEGKTLSEARPEVHRAIDIFYYYAEKAFDSGGTVKGTSSPEQELYTKREPLGVTGLITPWNYPIAIPAWKIAPALATGNTVILKPATLAPGPAHMIIKALDNAGIPDGVANLVIGSGSEVGEELTSSDEVDVVSFTGSSEVGDHVYANATNTQKRVQAEMGGKNPVIVASSADIGAAVDIVSAGAFGVTGQACTATSRAIVHTDVYQDFLTGVTQRAENLEVGSGLADSDMAPHVSEDELESTLKYIDIARNEGATHLTGGERLTSAPYENGLFVTPAVFADVEPNMRIFREEVFGPVLAVTEVQDVTEAIELANDSRYGLSASIVTQNLNEAHTFVEEIEAGVAKVNEKTTGLDLHVPFGGVKQSSTNTYREQGDAALEFFTQTKTVYLNYEP